MRLLLHKIGLIFILILPIVNNTAYSSDKDENSRELVFPVPVRVELLSLNLDDVSNQLRGFSGTIKLKATWKDPHLVFDKKEVGANRIMFDDIEATKKLESIWNPGLKIINLKKPSQKQSHDLIIYSDGTIEHISTITGEFETSLDTKQFPFDEQELVLDIESTKKSKSEIHLVYDFDEEYDPSPTNLEGIPLWYLHGFKTKIDTSRGLNGLLYENIRFSIKAERASDTYVPMIFFPFFMILFFSLMLLWDVKIHFLTRLSVVLSSLVALITLQFTIALGYPDSNVINSLVLKLFSTGYIFELTLIKISYLLEIYKPKTLYSKSIICVFTSYSQWALPLLASVILTGYIIEAMN